VVHPRRRRQGGRRAGSPPHELTYCFGIAADPDDTSLVAAARAGDRGALDVLLRRHHERWWRLCRRLLGNDADAGDALQEGLIAIARGIRRYDGRAAFTTWAYRVVTNACLDEMRRRARRPVPGVVALLPDGGRAETAGVPHAAAPGPGPSPGGPDAAIEAVADRLDVDTAVARLPSEFRAAVVLRDLCDLDYAEIARVLDIPPGTVRSRIARGRALLADLLGNRAAAADRPTTQP
jgi:RNA polymerase sigma-70 factor (ECF subfamily)